MDDEKVKDKIAKNLKLGIHENSANHKKLAGYLHYHTLASGDKQASLADYLARMKEDQKDIPDNKVEEIKETKDEAPDELIKVAASDDATGHNLQKLVKEASLEELCKQNKEIYELIKADSEEMDKTEGAGSKELLRDTTAQEDVTADHHLRELAKEESLEEMDEAPDELLGHTAAPDDVADDDLGETCELSKKMLRDTAALEDVTAGNAVDVLPRRSLRLLVTAMKTKDTYVTFVKLSRFLIKIRAVILL